ncbi:MAG: hypothetical protein ABSG79_03045 [Bryobacteraceae bacterium]|jgi:hypothetical protein
MNLRFSRKSRYDIILNRNEELIDLHNGCIEEYLRLAYECDLFFTIDYWLKYYKSNSALYEGDQANVVQQLYLEIVNMLCTAFKVSVNVLPRELETMFGRELTGEGHKVDVEWGQGGYVKDKTELGKYRLRFKDGKVYQYPWWEASPSNGALVLAESKRAQPTKSVHVGASTDKPNWGYCVMTMNREIYMAQHAMPERLPNGKLKLGTYHSYYLQGQPTQFAGSMLIKNGAVEGVCPDSGHYKPTDNSTLALLWALQMFGVSLDGVAVFPWDAGATVMANDFVASKGDWNALVANGTVSHNRNVQDWLVKQPPEIKAWVKRQNKIDAWLDRQRQERQASLAPQVPQTPAMVLDTDTHYDITPVTVPGVVIEASDYSNYVVYQGVSDQPQEDYIPDVDD